jgi:hypothetical protein
VDERWAQGQVSLDKLEWIAFDLFVKAIYAEQQAFTFIIWGHRQKGSSGIIMNTQTTRKYRSELLAESHKTIEALYQNGMVPKTTLREFDEACLAPVNRMSPEEIRQLREKTGVSQPLYGL